MPLSPSAQSPPSSPLAILRRNSAWRSLAQWVGRLLLVLYFALALLVLAGRYLILPEIAAYRGEIEQQLSRAIGLPVKIAAVSAEWPGLRPQLHIDQLQVHDLEGRPALAFDRVEAEIGWSSLWRLRLHLHRLEIMAPALEVRRTADGVVFVAGLPLQDDGEANFTEWLLLQGRVVIRDARVLWHDEQRGAPPLALQHLNAELRNSGAHHSFGLNAELPAHLATRLDVRGNLVGRNPDDLANWRGDLYADVGRTDLAAWAPWFDAPLELTGGQGGLRLWFSFENLQPTGFTADVQLADLGVRLQPGLPVLKLQHLDGRLAARRSSEGLVGEITRLSLATMDGVALPPTDALLRLNTVSKREGGEFRANALDLGALAALASHLPLPKEAHQRLQNFAPRGRLSGLEYSWRGAFDAPARWQVKGRFAELGLATYQRLPGFSGLSGRLEGDERAGQVYLDSENVQLALPSIFPEPTLALSQLNAEIGWQVPVVPASHGEEGQKFDLSIARLAFANPDASGELTGRYRYTGSGPGEIDLSAKLTRGVGNAVWRYMPLAVGAGTRDWLRASILGGQSSQASLRLKGPLEHFPFRDGKHGIFQVKGTFQGGSLDYATGWPGIIDIDGELLFEGVRMLIRGQRATLAGVRLSEVSAEIRDLEVFDEILTVSGRASGETQQFLDFIEASPVGGQIDHFTQAMTASGKGDLNLKLVLPLRRLTETKVQGRYRFAENQVRVLPELPLFGAAQGEIAFTSNSLQAKNLRAQLLGSPVTLELSSAPGGLVRVNASGSVPALMLRQEYGWRALDHLSGEVAWRGTVAVKKPGAEIRLESTLVGLASSLPEPLNKSARDALALRIDGRIGPSLNEWTATLGLNAAVRLQQGGGSEAWRGRIALGEAAVRQAQSVPPGQAAPGQALPGAGVMLAIAQPRLDLDAWRRLQDKAVAKDGKAGAAPLALGGLDVRSADVRVADRHFHDVQLTGVRADQRWRFNIDSREAKGQVTWDESGAGRISGRLSQLTVPAAEHAQPAMLEDDPRELPALDLQIDNLKLRDMNLGELKLLAENREGVWRAQAEIKNDAAQLSGEGRWRPRRSTAISAASTPASETALSFKLDANNAEKLLGRLGMPDAMRRGTVLIEGDVTWRGAPHAFDLSNLAGKLKVDAAKGQFKKLEPGVGRLLGVLSLQSLPRRISLDFRDVFSEGFAFDSITGVANINRGVMQTDELNILGPSARVLLAGKVNLLDETQDLKVRVQPALGESIAVGAMIVNPVAGAVAWLAQKALSDPLDQAFAFEYSVTGGWKDPKVEKINRSPPGENRQP